MRKTLLDGNGKKSKTVIISYFHRIASRGSRERNSMSNCSGLNPLFLNLFRRLVLVSSALDQLCGFLPCYVGYVVKVFVVGDYVGDV